MDVLLTGATSGIGEATARRLAQIVGRLAVHGPERADEVRPLLDDLRRETEVMYFSADFGRLRDVGTLIDDVRDRFGAFDVLINNAGRPGAPRRTMTGDGHEATFQTNFLAPVALTTGLIGSVRRRVINVCSATHYSATLALDDLELEHGYSPTAAYAHSKLAGVTYTCWLARHTDGIEAVALHPGVIATELLHAMFGAGGAPTDRGADNIMRLVQHAPGINGEYFDEDVPARPNAEALSTVNQDALMEQTARALGRAGLPAPDNAR